MFSGVSEQASADTHLEETERAESSLRQVSTLPHRTPKRELILSCQSAAPFCGVVGQLMIWISGYDNPDYYHDKVKVRKSQRLFGKSAEDAASL